MTRVELAAANNAHLYEAVCGAHGCAIERTDEVLRCLGMPPRFYSQAVTLRPDLGEIVGENRSVGFKDSFSDLTPNTSRYQVLFSASWIWCDEPPRTSPNWDWHPVPTGSELLEWESEWARGDEEAARYPRQFPASLLERDDVKFYAAWKDAKCVGGMLVNVSPPVVGISNVFRSGVSETCLWREIRALVDEKYPTMPKTGYERGDSLEAAVAVGFKAIGDLRVWVPTGA